MEKQHKCAVCNKNFKSHEIIHADVIREGIYELLEKDIPNWNKSSEICIKDLHFYQNRYIHNMLESQKGELSTLEHKVLDSMQQHELISTSTDSTSNQEWSRGERIADKIATFGGSWKFIGFFALFLIIWIAINSMVIFWNPIDPYPFILLNLVLSCLAAIQAPIIMMSQNRQEAKDRLRSEYDYKVNLKAEREIRELHKKVDSLLFNQEKYLNKIEELQAKLLEK